MSGSFSYVGRMYLEQLRGLFESVCLARAHLRLDHLVWKILTVSVERSPIKLRAMILMVSVKDRALEVLGTLQGDEGRPDDGREYIGLNE